MSGGIPFRVISNFFAKLFPTAFLKCLLGRRCDLIIWIDTPIFKSLERSWLGRKYVGTRLESVSGISFSFFGAKHRSGLYSLLHAGDVNIFRSLVSKTMYVFFYSDHLFNASPLSSWALHYHISSSLYVRVWIRMSHPGARSLWMLKIISSLIFGTTMYIDYMNILSWYLWGGRGFPYRYEHMLQRLKV